MLNISVSFFNISSKFVQTFDICPIGPYGSINCSNRGIGRRNNMPARSFLIKNALSAASKLRTPNVYCWSRKTLVVIHWTHLRVNLICIKSFCPQRDDRDIAPIQSYQTRDQPPRQAILPPPTRSPMAPRRNDGRYMCGRFGCHSVSHSDQRPPTPRYHSIPTQTPRFSNPFQDDRVDQYSPPVPPRQGNAPRAPMSGDR